MRLPSKYSSTAKAIHINNDVAYVIGTTFDTTRIAVNIGKLHIIDLNTTKVIDSIIISTNPIEFDPISNNFFVFNDTLNYFAFGEERRDTLINGQNIFTHYQHFKYNLKDGSWYNNTFPAINENGLQFVAYRNAFINHSNVYSANKTFELDSVKTDVLITKLDHFGNIIWNKTMASDTSQSIWNIIEDQDNNIIYCGTSFDLARDRRSGFNHFYMDKISAQDGSLIKQFVIEENSGLPRALIEDPNGGYIVSAGDAEFVEGGRYPAITRIIKIDNMLDSIVWELPLSDTLSFNSLWHLDKFISLGNNEFLGVGVSDSNRLFTHLGRVVKFTGDGELIFDKEIYNIQSTIDLEQRLEDVVPYKDGFVACGTMIAFSDSIISPRQQGWVVSFDKDGNTDFTSPTNDLILVDSGFVNVFPNPASTYLDLTFDDRLEENVFYQIYTIEGREIQQGQLARNDSKYRIDLPATSTGTHILTLRTSERIINKLFIVE